MTFSKSLSLRALRLFHKDLIPLNLSMHPTGDFISDWIRKNNRYYEFDMLHFMRRNFDYSRFLDIGANIGNHSHFFKSLGSTGWCFEPSSANFKMLELNHYDGNFECFNLALSNISTVDSLVTFEDARGNSYVQSTFDGNVNEWGSGMSIEKIETRTLDSFELERPTLVKIDVEGSELKVLEGSVKTLLTWRPTVAIEIHEDETLSAGNFPYTRKNITDFFTNIGYSHFVLYNSTNHFFQSIEQ